MDSVKSGDKLPDRVSHESSEHPTLLRLGRCGVQDMCFGPEVWITMEDVWRVQSEAERYAEQILDKAWDGRYPVDVLKIADYLKIDIRYVNFPNGTAGVIIKRADDSHPVIFLDDALIIQRERFTIAHEIGHYIEHRNLVGAGVGVSFLYDDSEFGSDLIRASRAPGLGGWPDKEMYELFADIFAHALLMPADKVEAFAGLGMDPSLVAEYFRVSEDILKNRLSLLHLKL